MAKQLLVEVIDDIDGSILDEAGESIEFAVGGVVYKIDLKRKHAKEFHKQLGFYIDHAARVGPTSDAPRNARSAAQAAKRDPEQLRAIRQWARNHGHPVSDRGRIAADIVAAFESAH